MKTFFDNTLSRRKKENKKQNSSLNARDQLPKFIENWKKKKKLCVKHCRHRLIYFYLESLLLFVITSSKLECSKIHNCSYSVSFQCDKNKIEMTIELCIIIRPLMGSTDQADPSCFYFRVAWTLIERRWIYNFCLLCYDLCTLCCYFWGPALNGGDEKNKINIHEILK